MNFATIRFSMVGLVIVGLSVWAFTQPRTAATGPESSSLQPAPRGDTPVETNDPTDTNLKQATIGGGCFWCVEAVFLEVAGIKSAVSGYAGGHVPNPTYEQVCAKTTGHAEVVQLTYDPEVITFPEILEIFWKTHDPTTLNRQGADVGPQYRSIILYHDQEQKELAEKYKARLDESGAFDNPIVTEIAALETFYPAENYHQNYYKNNPFQGYCAFVIRPKMEKFRKAFAEKLKKD